MEKWEDPSKATKKVVFKMGLILINKFEGIKPTDTANTIQNENEGRKGHSKK